MKLKVTLSANAGICLDLGGFKIWVDALHDEKVSGFSTVSPALFREIMTSEEFSNPDVICVTHRHPDHYSEELVKQAFRKYPHAELLIADASLGNIFSWEKGDVRITFLRFTHDGEQYVDYLHYGILLAMQGKNILIPADCRLCDAALAEAVRGLNIDLTFLNFPWLTLKKAEQFSKECIQSKQVVLYHLPFQQDDINHYRQAAARVAEKWGEKVHLLMNPLETIILDI